MNQHLGCILVILLLSACGNSAENTGKIEVELATPDDLKLHSEEFVKQVVKVASNVHVAIGYGLANSILIEGDSGNIIVDCMESKRAAEEVKAEFAKISKKPIVALIYTHFHPDHTFGADVMAGDDNPMIIAHNTTSHELDKLINITRPIIGVRSYRMFGNLLDSDERVNCGIGPVLAMDEEMHMGALRPTKTFDKELEITIAGIDLKLVHAPGETDDQIFVWMPATRTLLSGDNFYKTFPNLYTIRGTSYRDVTQWYRSLDVMRYLNPEIVVPSHTKPIIGGDTIAKIFTEYRDAIQFVHDQTIRNINLGFTPDEIVERVKLPASLAQSPYLQEFYGRVDWSVRSIFNGYLGTFDGNPATLIPLELGIKANEIAALCGGAESLLEKASEAASQGKHQWVLELTDYLSLLDVNQERVKELRANALIALGEAQSNPNARHYYLTSAMELRGATIKKQEASEQILDFIPTESIFKNLSVNIVPEKCEGVNEILTIYFSDTDEHWSILVRNGVAEIQNFEVPYADLALTTTSVRWKKVITGLKGGLASYISGAIEMDKGSILEFGSFMDRFKAES